MTLLLLVINLNVCVSDSSWRSQRRGFYAGQRHRAERDGTDRLWGSLWMLWSRLCWHTSPALQDIITPLEWPTGVASTHYSSFASPDTEPRTQTGVSLTKLPLSLLLGLVCVFVGGFFLLSRSSGFTSSSSPHLLQVTTGESTLDQGWRRIKAGGAQLWDSVGQTECNQPIHPDGALIWDPLSESNLIFCVLARELLFNRFLSFF